MKQINAYERSVFSQNGEDGIIEEIFKRIGITNHFFVEFGVEDGTECNSLKLAHEGWGGVMIEGSVERYNKLAHNMSQYDKVKTMRQFITAENIETLFTDANVPHTFDLLSIDIDGNDYWVWSAITSYSPRVVVIEYNAYYPPTECWVMAYNPDHVWDGTTYQGASLRSLRALGLIKGYSLICTDAMGVNAFFVRNSDLNGFSALTAKDAYHSAGYYGHMNKGSLGHPFRDGPHHKV